MATGLQGQKRPDDTVGAAIASIKVAIGELEEKPKTDKSDVARQLATRHTGTCP